MSTKTIAVETGVYSRLAASRREGESFSKAISRLLDEAESANTGADILARIGGIAPLSDTDAAHFLDVVVENRERESWARHDLR